MTEPMTEQSTHRHRHHRPESRWKQIWRQYGFEIIIAGVVALGVFLLLEQMSIRLTLIRWLGSALSALLHGVGQIDNVARDTLEHLTLSNALGLVLIFGALLAIVLRLRWQLMHRPALTVMTCPTCGSELRQTHRRPIERLIDWYIPLRRYRCRNHDCGWAGFKIKASKTGGGRFRIGKGEVVVYALLVILAAIFVGIQIAVRDGGSAEPAAWLQLNGTVSRCPNTGAFYC